MLFGRAASATQQHAENRKQRKRRPPQTEDRPKKEEKEGGIPDEKEIWEDTEQEGGKKGKWGTEGGKG